MSDASSVKVAIVGASGYSGEELVHRLLHHPQTELAAVTSRQYANQTLAQIFPASPVKVWRIRPVHRTRSRYVSGGAEIVFLALPRGVAAEYAEALLMPVPK